MKHFLGLAMLALLCAGTVGCGYGPHNSQINRYHRYDQYDRYNRHDNRYDQYDRYNRHDNRYQYNQYQQPYQNQQFNQMTTQQMVMDHNQARRGHGLLDLQPDYRLDHVAQQHAEYMARTGNLTHRGYGGSTVRDRIGGYYRYVGENIAAGCSGRQIMNEWLGSYSHRSHILDRNYRLIGVGVAQGANGMCYWCVVFAG